jgi:predicted DNA-binding transcriptional regulator AlpA
MARLVKKHHLDHRIGQIRKAEPPGMGHNRPPSDDDMLTTEEVAKWLGVSVQWLEIGRCKGYGPPFVKLSTRAIRYRRGAVKQYLCEREYASTAEYPDAAT